MLYLQESGTVTIALDGNFGLVRKKNSGNSYGPPVYGTVYFVSQDETDEFVASYNNDNAKDRVCTSFKTILAFMFGNYDMTVHAHNAIVSTVLLNFCCSKHIKI